MKLSSIKKTFSYTATHRKITTYHNICKTDSQFDAVVYINLLFTKNWQRTHRKKTQKTKLK